MKVLLVSANTLTEPYPVYPLGLDYVAAAIAASHQVQIADINSLGDYESLTDVIRQFSPDAIGLALRNVDTTDTTDPREFIGQYRELVARIRKQSRALLILGGSGFTIFPAETMRALKADYGIIGEGERLALLLDALENQQDPTAIAGVVNCRTPEKIPPPWDGQISRNFNPALAHLPYYLKNGGMLNLQTKRGCHFRCIYCSYPHIEGRKLRRMDPAAAAETALGLQGAGAKFFFITDSVFNSDSDHSLAVARAFKKAGVAIPWGAFFAPVKGSADYFATLRAAGLTHVEFGTDSLSDAVLESYRKPFRTRQVFKTHRAAVDAGLHVAHYFLLGGPGENSDTLNETLSNVDRLRETVLFFFCGMRIYPHTELYATALRQGIMPENASILQPVFYCSKAIGTDEIIDRVQDCARGRVNWVIGAGGQETAATIAQLYKRGHSGPLWEYLIR